LIYKRKFLYEYNWLRYNFNIYLMKVLKKEDFIDKSIKLHGDKYDYSNVNYINSRTKIDILCPKHVIFAQKPNSHLNGSGCPNCVGVKKKVLQEFINDAIKIHGDKYDYSNVNYINNSTKVAINCKKHGEFLQTPHIHLNGSGCSICYGTSNKTLTKGYKLIKI
jgi:hypothetical protein